MIYKIMLNDAARLLWVFFERHYDILISKCKFLGESCYERIKFKHYF
jgi:hypothetical protein